MSSSPVRPKALNAALIAVEATAQDLADTATFFVFQYNPDKLVRTFSYFNPDGTPALDSKVTLKEGSPVEFIYLRLELDAADQLERPDQNASFAQNGLHPALVTLESMMSLPATANTKTEPKVVLFFWGPKRLLPTQLVSLKVTEEAFDLDLNPIRANIDLCLRVMKISELKIGSIGYNICLNQIKLNDKLASIYEEYIGGAVLSQVSGQIASTSTGLVTGTGAGGVAASGTGVAAGVGKVGIARAAARKKSVAEKSKTRKVTKR